MDTWCYEIFIEEMNKQWVQKHIIQALSDTYATAAPTKSSLRTVSRCEEVFVDANDPQVGACFGK